MRRQSDQSGRCRAVVPRNFPRFFPFYSGRLAFDGMTFRPFGRRTCRRPLPPRPGDALHFAVMNMSGSAISQKMHSLQTCCRCDAMWSVATLSASVPAPVALRPAVPMESAHEGEKRKACRPQKTLLLKSLYGRTA